MLHFLNKSSVWEHLESGRHTELGWHNSAIHLKTWQDTAVYEHLRKVKDKKIAEIGGGNSRILRQLSKNNMCVNVDKLLGADGGPKGDPNIPNVRTVSAFMGESSPELQNNSFDFVFSVSVIEHVPNIGMTAFMDDVVRIMKPGGLSFHAIDLYLANEVLPGPQTRLNLYNKWLEREDIEALEPPVAKRAVFSTEMATNPDLAMWQWNRVAPNLRDLRETSQSVSLFLAFRKL